MATVQSRGTADVDVAAVAGRFLRLVTVDLALRLFALHRLTGLPLPDAEPPSWVQENGGGRVLRHYLRRSGLTRRTLADRLGASYTHRGQPAGREQPAQPCLRQRPGQGDRATGERTGHLLLFGTLEDSAPVLLWWLAKLESDPEWTEALLAAGEPWQFHFEHMAAMHSRSSAASWATLRSGRPGERVRIPPAERTRLEHDKLDDSFHQLWSRWLPGTVRDRVTLRNGGWANQIGYQFSSRVGTRPIAIR